MASLLHIVNRSPYTHGALANCMRFAAPGDAVLLIEDGVYGALARLANKSINDPTLNDPALDDPTLARFVLGPDLAARGLSDWVLIEGSEIVDYRGFVQLCTRYDQIQSWL